MSASASAAMSAAVEPPPETPRSRLPDPPTPDPEAVKAFRARLDRPAVKLAEVADPLASEPTGKPKGDGPSRVTAMALESTARGEAAGMTADARLWFAVLSEGQRATTRVELAPGSCATFIAEGGLGVMEADAFLTTGEGSDLQVVAEDVGRGPISIIGGRTRCFPNSGTSKLVVDLHVTARRGGGPILVRAYRRQG
jgi:hypothetical protein